MKTSFENMATRMVNAENDFIETLMQLGEISEPEAEKVLNLYFKHRLVKMDAVIGVINVKHGGYLDKATIANAVAICRTPLAV